MMCLSGRADRPGNESGRPGRSEHPSRPVTFPTEEQRSMTTLSRHAVPFHASPSVRKALGELATLLEDYRYSQHARESICAHVAREGTVTGAPGLEAEDEADASMVYEAELTPVPFDSPAWDDESAY